MKPLDQSALASLVASFRLLKVESSEYKRVESGEYKRVRWNVRVEAKSSKPLATRTAGNEGTLAFRELKSMRK